MHIHLPAAAQIPVNKIAVGSRDSLLLFPFFTVNSIYLLWLYPRLSPPHSIREVFYTTRFTSSSINRKRIWFNPDPQALDLYLQGALDSPFASFECQGWKSKDHNLDACTVLLSKRELPTDHVLCVGLYYAIGRGT